MKRANLPSNIDKVSRLSLTINSLIANKMRVLVSQSVIASLLFLALSEAQGDHGACKAFPGTTAVSRLLLMNLSLRAIDDLSSLH